MRKTRRSDPKFEEISENEVPKPKSKASSMGSKAGKKPSESQMIIELDQDQENNDRNSMEEEKRYSMITVNDKTSERAPIHSPFKSSYKPEQSHGSGQHGSNETGEFFGKDFKSPYKITPIKMMSRFSMKSQSPLKSVHRLIVDRVVCTNFKSYAGSQTIGPFHKNFTAVIGPNGSGKSNLIESLVFIFGRKASAMRLKQLSQLIHNSAMCSNAPSATVEVHFKEIIDTDLVDGYEEVPNSAFVVKRIVTKNSSTTYKINETITTQKEVIDLLKSKGIDLDNNRFMILQHEVEAISLMKPKSGDSDDPGLLEYLEDIIGSSKYVERIDTLEIEVLKLKDLEFEKAQRVGISEMELKGLNEAKNQAIGYVKKEKQVFQMRAAHMQILCFNAENQSKELQKKISEVLNQKTEQERLRDEKIAENKEIAKEIKRMGKEKERNQREIDRNKQDQEKMNEDDERVRDDIKHLVSKETKAKGMLENMKKEVDTLMQDKTKLEKTLPGEKAALEKVEKKRDELQKEVDQINVALRSEGEELRRKKAEIQNKLQPLKTRMVGIKGKFEEKTQELDMFLKQSSDQTSKKAEVENDLRIQVEKRERSDGIKSMNEKLKMALGGIDEEIAPKREELDKLHKTDLEVRQKMNEIRMQLEENKNAKNEKQSSNRVVNEVIKASMSGKLKGVVGRLGSLGTIDPTYDVAVSTAGGNQLDMIIVNTYEQAQAVISFCKSNTIGVVTCLALDKVESWIKEASIRSYQTPANSRRLFDLVNIHPQNEKIRPCFYQVFRDTLVCDSIEIGRTVAFKSGTRNRVVTLDGKIIDKSGVMSGGGRPRRGGMAPKGSGIADVIPERELEDMQNQLTELGKQQIAIQNGIAEAKGKLEEYQHDRQILKSELDKNEMELKVSDQTIANLKEKLRALNEAISRRADNEKKIAGLQKTLGEQKKELDELLTEIEREEKKQKEVDFELNSLGTPQQRKAKEDLQRVSKEFETKEEDLMKKQAKFNQADSSIEKAKKSCAAKEKEIETIAENIRQLSEVKFKENEARFMEILARQKKLQAEKIEVDAKYNECMAKVDNLGKILEQYVSKIKSLQSENDELQKRAKKTSEERSQAQEKLLRIQADYRALLDNYDFMDDLEALEAADIEEIPSQRIEKRMNQESEMMIEGENNNNQFDSPGSSRAMESQGDHHDTERKRMHFEISMLDGSELTHTLSQAKLVEISKFEGEIKERKLLESEELEKLRPNLQSINEFSARFKEHVLKKQELAKMTQEFNEKKNELEVLKSKRKNEFLEGFTYISIKLKETYQVDYSSMSKGLAVSFIVGVEHYLWRRCGTGTD